MGRPKKDAIALNVKLESQIMERFEIYCDEMGQTKTKALERILGQYLDDYAVMKKTGSTKHRSYSSKKKDAME